MTPIHSADDLAPGQEFDLGSFVLTRAEVLDFARKFDPQPFHLDEEAARGSMFGRLVASGVHTFAATVGHIIRSGLFAQVNQGAGGAELKWVAALEPDMPVTLRITVEEVRPMRSKPQLAVVKLRYIVAQETDGTVVLEVLAPHFMKR
jgi:acyl dehydratase